MVVETPEYEVLRHEGAFELRRYNDYVTANVRVTASDYARAMNAGFDPLADYIFGNNHVANRIAMTAPVTAGRACCQKISMTAPVAATQSGSDYVVSFTMPHGSTIEELPQPNNGAVSIQPVSVHLAAAVRFGGGLSGSKAAVAQAQLELWIEQQGLAAVGEPIAAQYDPPWKPGFARRNEIMIVVEQP